jgi:hypothetical protein
MSGSPAAADEDTMNPKVKAFLGLLIALGILAFRFAGLAHANPHDDGDVGVGSPCPHAQNNQVIQAVDGTWVRCVADFRPGHSYTWVPDTGVRGPDCANGTADRPPADCRPS